MTGVEACPVSAGYGEDARKLRQLYYQQTPTVLLQRKFSCLGTNVRTNIRELRVFGLMSMSRT